MYHMQFHLCYLYILHPFQLYTNCVHVTHLCRSSLGSGVHCGAGMSRLRRQSSSQSWASSGGDLWNRALVLWEVHETGRTAVALSDWLCRNEQTIGDGSLYRKGVFNLVEGTVLAFQSSVDTTSITKGLLNLVRSVVLGCGWHDALNSEDVVCRDGLEKVDGLSKEVDDLLVRLIVGEARWVQGGITCSVLVPFMLPERLVSATLVLPVLLHVG